MLTINSMDNTKSIRIIDIQSREIDPYTISEQYRGDPSYLVQLFGLDEQRNTYSVFVEGFAPYFYVKIDAGNKKSNFTEEGFEQWLSEKLADKYIKLATQREEKANQDDFSLITNYNNRGVGVCYLVVALALFGWKLTIKFIYAARSFLRAIIYSFPINFF